MAVFKILGCYNKKFFFVLNIILSASGFAQLFSSSKGLRIFYADIKGDSTRIEIFSTTPYNAVYKITDEHRAYKKNTEDTIFRGIQTQLLKSKGEYYLLYKKSKIKLEKCANDKREFLRKEAYSTQIQRNFRRLKDSLSGPAEFINSRVTRAEWPSGNNPQSYIEYTKAIDRIFDSLTGTIIKLKSSDLDNYYRLSDSLLFIDSSKVFSLLSKAKYNFYYSQFFLNKTALQRPELLIQYIDKNPSNKDTVLRAIRNHSNYQQIIKSIKETTVDSKGKKEIVRQKFNRNLQRGANTTLYVTIILSEIALITGLCILLFKS